MSRLLTAIAKFTYIDLLNALTPCRYNLELYSNLNYEAWFGLQTLHQENLKTPSIDPKWFESNTIALHEEARLDMCLKLEMECRSRPRSEQINSNSLWSFIRNWTHWLMISGMNLLKSWQSDFENSCINQIHEVGLKISKSKIIFLSSFKGLSVFCDFKFELKPLSPILLMRNHLRYSIFLWLFLFSLWLRTIWGPTEHNIQLMIHASLVSHCALFVASSSFGAVPSMSTVLSLSHAQGTETPNQSTFFSSEFYWKTTRCSH